MVLSVVRSDGCVAGKRNQYKVPPEPGTFGAELRRLREAKGWTQIQLAEMISERVGYEFRQGQISAYERGVHRFAALEVTRVLDDLFAQEPGTFFALVGLPAARRAVERDAGKIVITPDEDDPHYQILLLFGDLPAQEQYSLIRSLRQKRRARQGQAAPAQQPPADDEGTRRPA